MATKRKAVKKAAVKKAAVKKPAAKKSVPLKKAVAAVDRRRTRADRRDAKVDRRGGMDLHAVQHAVEQFLYAQAALLDDKRWQDWIDLFTPEGVYWMPSEPSQLHWDGQPAIFAEDKNLMTVRMKRVLHPDAWSQRPLWETNRLIGNVVLDKVAANGDVVVRSRFQAMELRRDDVRHFAGQTTHYLKKTRDGWRIVLQRVDMTNAQATYEYVLQVWV